jgi:predicted phosphodiesterase
MTPENERILAEAKEENPNFGRRLLFKEAKTRGYTGSQSAVQRWLERQIRLNDIEAPRAKILEKLAYSPYSDADLLAILKSSKQGTTTNVHNFNWGGDKAKLLVFSDPHIGNKVFRDDWWYAMWDAAAKYGAEMAFCIGDVLEGPPIRPGHIYECSEIGWDAQKNKAFELMEDIPLVINGVMGNHDLWYMQKGNSGISPGKELDQHTNFNYLGDHFATVKVGTLDIGLHHGLDGAAYALGYRIQKIIEAMSGGDKPHVLFTGHDHKQGHFHYRNVQAIASGTMCPQTTWMRGKRLQAACGFYIIDLEWNSKGLESIAPRWFPLYS